MKHLINILIGVAIFAIFIKVLSLLGVKLPDYLINGCNKTWREDIHYDSAVEVTKGWYIGVRGKAKSQIEIYNKEGCNKPGFEIVGDYNNDGIVVNIPQDDLKVLETK